MSCMTVCLSACLSVCLSVSLSVFQSNLEPTRECGLSVPPRLELPLHLLVISLLPRRRLEEVLAADEQLRGELVQPPLRE